MSYSRVNPEKRRERQRKSLVASTIQLLVIILLSVGLSQVINAFILTSFHIPSESMNNTLEVNDRIMVNKLVPTVLALHRGDVVVFEDPSNWLPDSDKPNGEGYLVKRVIAIGGDTISCCDNEGRILVNGEPIDEPYIQPGDVPSEIEFDEKVPEGYVWVMGDNRDNSKDSRFQGDSESGKFVPLESIVGKAFAVMWPVNHWTFI